MKKHIKRLFGHDLVFYMLVPFCIGMMSSYFTHSSFLIQILTGTIGCILIMANIYTYGLYLTKNYKKRK